MQEWSALETDMYQFKMAAVYYSLGVESTPATFDLFIRKMPQTRNYFVVAGIEEALKFLSEYRLTKEDVEYLRQDPGLSSQPEAFFDYLQALRFEGDVWTMREGTPAFGEEPIMIVRAPVAQGQLVETYLENVVGSRTMFASKASRLMDVISPQVGIEFGTRRSQDPKAATACARSAYIAGFSATSNVEAGRRYGVPVVGTMAHSIIMFFDVEGEPDVFRAYAKVFPKSSIFLVDTYDSERGLKNAIMVGKEMKAVGERLIGIRQDHDPGDLAGWSRDARKACEDEGLKEAEISLSGNLNEYRIAQLKADRVDCQTWDVGTALSTSSDAPSVDIVYKLSEVVGKMRMKVTPDKDTLPGFKQVRRYVNPYTNKFYRDEIGLMSEQFRSDAMPLLKKVMENGKIIANLPSLKETRDYAAEQKRKLPYELKRLEKAQYSVSRSAKLKALQGSLRTDINKRVEAALEKARSRVG
jgi:nicotinate phosphoribosyltransferase